MLCCAVLSCLVLACPVLACLVLSYIILWRLVVSCGVSCYRSPQKPVSLNALDRSTLLQENKSPVFSNLAWLRTLQSQKQQEDNLVVTKVVAKDVVEENSPHGESVRIRSSDDELESVLDPTERFARMCVDMNLLPEPIIVQTDGKV